MVALSGLGGFWDSPGIYQRTINRTFETQLQNAINTAAWAAGSTMADEIAKINSNPSLSPVVTQDAPEQETPPPSPEPDDPDDIFEFDPFEWSNPFAGVFELPSRGVLNGYEEVFTRLPGYDPEDNRSPYRSGFGPGHITLDRVSPNAIDDFHGAAANLAALGGTIDFSMTAGPDGIDGDWDSSAQAERIFEGAGLEFLQDRTAPPRQDDSWIEIDGSIKGIVSFLQATHFEHDLEGLNRQSSSLTLAQYNEGIGGVSDIRIPFTDHRIRLGAAQVSEVALGRVNSTTAAGIDAEDGVYGVALGGGGYAKGVTANESTYLTFDTGFGIRVKGSGTVHASAFSEGADALFMGVWDDNTGTLSLEATGGVAKLLGVEADLAGEIQVEQLAGSVASVEELSGEIRDGFIYDLPRRLDPRNSFNFNF